MDSGGEDSGLDGVVDALVEGQAIDWTEVRGRFVEHGGQVQSLELLDQVGRAFRDAGEEPGAQPPPFQWGPLQVVEMLGAGSFGEVFRAHDLVLDREVALKLRHRDDDASRNRGYVEEARRLARVRHPNVVIVHGAEVHDGRAGLWTELIDGDTLEGVLERQGPMGAREALAAGLDLCRALAAVHAAGLLHGDVKLANVMREVGGRTVLMDFGAGRELLRPTRDAPAFGTPVVTAPEVLNGEAPTVAADLYSLGALLFRALTGTHRIEAETLSELLRKHEARDCRGLRDLRPDLAYETVRAVERALERAPEDRYTSAGAMERGLAGALDQELSRVSDATVRGGAQPVSESGVAAQVRRRRVVPGEPDFQPFVGRLGELAALDEALRQARAGTPRPIVIRGIAGVGKSELTRTFLERAAASGATTLYARYLDYEGSRLAPFETLLRLLRSALGVESATELVAAARDRCGVRLPAELLSEPAVDLSTPVVSARTEVTAGDRFRGAVPIAECFRALARDRPLVLALDDLQWSDAATLDVVGYLMRSLEEEALLLLLVARQEDTGEDRSQLAAWLRRHAGYRTFTSLELHPFGEREIHAALEAIFPGLVSTRDIPPHQLAELSRLTGGNPYFLNEICRLLTAHRRVVFDTESSGGWKWKGWGDLALPETLVLAAGARLDRLSEEVRGLLDPAAVIGDEFRVETLAATCDLDSDPDAIEGLLQEAVDAGVLAHATSEGEDYRFDHPILHTVVYDTLPPRRRRKLHRQAARALETIYAGARERVASALSAHWSAADEPAPTLEWSLEAWLAARGRWQWPEAVACLERADAAARGLEARGEPLPAARKYRLALGLAEGYASVGRLKESETKVAACVALAEELADTAAEGAAWLQGARTAGALGRYADAVRQAERARDLFTETGDRDGQALARLQLATIYAATGEYEQVRTTAEEIAKLVPADSETAAVAAGVAGWSLALQGHYTEGLPLLERAREHHERAGNVRQRALLLNRLQWVHRSRGHYEEAVATARLAREEFRKVEDANFEAKANMALGQSRLAQGLVEEGRAHLERTLAGLAEIGDAHCEAEARWLLGRALGELGDYDAAARSLARALKMIAEIGDRDDEFRFLIDRARVERRAGRVEDALRSARAAREIAEELDNAEGSACARVETARAARAAGDTDTALAEAQAAAELLDELGSGELWRALHALGQARAAGVDASPDPTAVESALEPLRRAVALVSAIREQIPAQDAHRRALAAKGLAAPARDLHRLLLRAGLEAEAKEIAAIWPIPYPGGGEMERALVRAVSGRAETGDAEAGGSRHRVGSKWLWIAAGIAAATLVGYALWNSRVEPTETSAFHAADWQLRDMQLFSASPGNQNQATFSPDGRMVAFVDDIEGVPQIGIRAVAGGESLRVTEGEAAASRPRWSSRDEIVFSRNGGIWAVPALGGEPRQVVAAGTHPDVSHDGTLVVYEHDRWLWTVAADGGPPRRLEAVPRRFFAEAWGTPALSPDASQVAYFMQEAGPNGDIWVAPIDGGEPRRLTFDRVEAGGPVWTPDGRGIVFWSRRHGTLNLWRLQLDSGSLQPLTTGVGEDTAPAISADGRRLVFTNTQNRWTLVGHDPETGEERELLDRRLPIWLPEVSTDGRRVAFFQAVGPSYHLFTLGLDGSGLRQVTTGEGVWNIHPRWSRDGDSIYYYQERPQEAFRRVPASGGESELIAEGWDWLTQMQAVPSPDDSRIAYVEHDEHTGSTLIWDPSTGQRASLPEPHIHSPQWSPDGRVLIGFTHGGEIRRCEVDRGVCDRLTDGFRPRFSADGGTVYLHRRSGGAQWELWSIDLDGRNERRLSTTGPHGPLDPTFAVMPNGEAIYTRYRPGRSELWIASLQP